MKVRLQSTIQTPYIDVNWMEEGQLVFQAGNSLCIRDIAKNTDDFINLNKACARLYSFTVSPNHKYIFTAEHSPAGI